MFQSAKEIVTLSKREEVYGKNIDHYPLLSINDERIFRQFSELLKKRTQPSGRWFYFSSYLTLLFFEHFSIHKATVKMTPSTHEVYRLSSQGSHHNIHPHTEPLPTIDSHEILLKICGLALNYRDIVIANGSYPFPVKDGVIPCSDASGEIIKVGSLVDGFKVGDYVVASFDATNLYGPQKDWHHGHGGPVDGFLCEYAALAASAVVKIPEATKLSFVQMAALVCTGVTAWNALYGNIPLKPGQTVLFQGKEYSSIDRKSGFG